ncbi:MAG: oligosaccharide flippase family protein [Candidatus Paceibacterota bacterium]
MKYSKYFIRRVLNHLQRYTGIDMAYAAGGSFWLVGEKIITTITTIVVLTAFANLVPQETYGDYQFVIAVAGTLALFSLPGISTALVRGVARGKEGSLGLAFRTRFYWSFIGAAGMAGVGVWYLVSGESMLAGAFFVAGLFFSLYTVTPIYLEFWEGKGRFDVRAFYQVLCDAGISGAIIITLLVSDRLEFIVLAFFAGVALFHGASYLRTRATVHNSEPDPDLVPFGKNLTVMRAVETVARHIDKIIVWQFLGAVPLAVYAFAIKPIERVKTFVPIQSLALPRLSEHGVHGSGRKRSVFRKFMWLFALTIPFAIALALLAPYVYRIIFPAYTDSVRYFQMLAVLIATMPLSVLVVSLIAEMKTRYLYIMRIIEPTVKIGLFVALVPFYGIWGIVIAMLVAEGVRAGLGVFLFWKM